MRLPFIPTLMVALMIPAMIGLGVWQLQRADWKATLLAELEAAPKLAAVDLDDPPAGPLSFRRASVTCTVGEAVPKTIAGRNLNGASGYSYRLPCREGVVVDAGWAKRPDATPAPLAQRRVTGIVLEAPLASAANGARFLLYAENAPGLLEPSAPPTVDTIPNNHMAYAVQWFLFAGTLLVIYLIYVRRRARP